MAIDTSFIANECGVEMSERISKNNVQSLSFQVTNHRATAINKTVIIPSDKYYIGAQIGGNNNVFDVGLFAGYKPKKTLYFLQYNAFSKSVYVGGAIGF